jgi:hypothetical protein
VGFFTKAIRTYAIESSDDFEDRLTRAVNAAPRDTAGLEELLGRSLTEQESSRIRNRYPFIMPWNLDAFEPYVNNWSQDATVWRGIIAEVMERNYSIDDRGGTIVQANGALYAFNPATDRLEPLRTSTDPLTGHTMAWYEGSTERYDIDTTHRKVNWQGIFVVGGLVSLLACAGAAAYSLLKGKGSSLVQDDTVLPVAAAATSTTGPTSTYTTGPTVEVTATSRPPTATRTASPTFTRTPTLTSTIAPTQTSTATATEVPLVCTEYGWGFEQGEDSPAWDYRPLPGGNQMGVITADVAYEGNRSLALPYADSNGNAIQFSQLGMNRAVWLSDRIPVVPGQTVTLEGYLLLGPHAQDGHAPFWVNPDVAGNLDAGPEFCRDCFGQFNGGGGGRLGIDFYDRDGNVPFATYRTADWTQDANIWYHVRLTDLVVPDGVNFINIAFEVSEPEAPADVMLDQVSLKVCEAQQ